MGIAGPRWSCIYRNRQWPGPDPGLNPSHCVWQGAQGTGFPCLGPTVALMGLQYQMTNAIYNFGRNGQIPLDRAFLMLHLWFTTSNWVCLPTALPSLLWLWIFAISIVRNVYLSVIFISISFHLSNTEHLFFYEPSVFGYFITLSLVFLFLFYIMFFTHWD